MASEKRGNPRKSRRARLPSASYVGRTRFAPSDEKWRRIEKALGYRITSEDADELTQVVDRYFDMHPFEAAAPFVSDAQAYLQSVITKGHEFLSTLQPPDSNEAAFNAQRLIVNSLPRQRRKGAVALHEFVMAIHEFMAACEAAKKKLQKLARVRARRTFVEGAAWRELVRKLTRFCRKRSLPTTVSKARAVPPSTFVAFVFELQRTFPEKFRRYNSSYAALATAIVDSRRRSARVPKARRTKR
jgi:hypothetical protein